jgi:hypothetical protein
MNSTYRALTNAGFNQTYFPQLRDVMFVTESEAAAIYTARYLKDREGTEFLRVFSAYHALILILDSLPEQINEPFILCDAGGGTVVCWTQYDI